MMHVCDCSGIGPPSSGLWFVDCNLGLVSEVDIDVDAVGPLPNIVYIREWPNNHIEEWGQHRTASAALEEYHFPKVEPVDL